MLNTEAEASFSDSDVLTWEELENTADLKPTALDSALARVEDAIAWGCAAIMQW